MLKLDIDILRNSSTKRLVVSDESFYGDIIAGGATLEITPPGWNKVVVGFTPNSANSYTSINMGLSCDDYVPLPDGIYKLKYSIFPNTTNFVEKTFMKADKLICKYGKVLLNLQLENECPPDKKEMQKMNEIRLLIEGSIAASNSCDNDLAYKLYDKANCLLDRIKLCSCE